MQNEKTTTDIITQRIASVEKQCKDATASASSSAFSRFTQQEFKELAIKTNREHHELISELFQNLDDIFETYIAFGKIFVVLEDQIEKREQASKSYDAIVDWQRYMKEKP